MAKNKSDKLTWKHIIGYGCGDCGGCICMVPIWYYMSRYLQVNLAINAGLLAAILMVWNIWDAVNDPLMGTIMDMTYAKAKPGKDKFRPWILASIPIMFIGTLGFYLVPGKLTGSMTLLIAVFCLKIVSEAGYTMMNIAMGSLLGNMATNDAERASLSSARGFGSTIAHMLGGVVAPLILARFGTGYEGYAAVAVIFVILGCIVVFLHYAMTEERNKAAAAVEKTPEQIEAEKFKLSDIWNIITKNRAFLGLVIHSISLNAVRALGTGVALYMYIDVLRDVTLQSLGSAISSGLQIAILTVAPFLAKKWDLVAIIRVCLVASAIGFLGLLGYTMTSTELNGVLYVFWNGIALALITMSEQMQWGLVAETIDYNEYLTGKRNEGTIYGFFSLSRRIGTTIANSLSVLLIAAIGFSVEASNAGLPQSDAAVTGIKVMVSGFPMIAAVISFCCFTFVWCINKDVRAKMAAWRAAKTGASN